MYCIYVHEWSVFIKFINIINPFIKYHIILTYTVHTWTDCEVQRAITFSHCDLGIEKHFCFRKYNYHLKLVLCVCSSCYCFMLDLVWSSEPVGGQIFFSSLFADHDQIVRWRQSPFCDQKCHIYDNLL